MTFQHRAGVRPYTSPCGFAESCVFSKQSLPPFLCNPGTLRSLGPSPARAHLLPKLRCKFAEFLNQGSLKRLGILSPPTCVGLRYGHPLFITDRGFSWKLGINHSRTRKCIRHHLSALKLRFLPTVPAYWLIPSLPINGWPILLRHPSAPSGGTGILTRFPSPTPFGLGLGPANPARITLAQETLGFRRPGFSPGLSLLMSAFSLPEPPTLLVGASSPVLERSPTTRPKASLQLRWHALDPLNFRRKAT